MSGIPKSEKAKRNMKGRSGTWKREDIHKERMLGSNNPMFGKTGDKNPTSRPEVREKIRQSKIGTTVVWSEDKKALQKERMKQWWSERKKTDAMASKK
jgi:hypothetical protein